MTCEVDVDRPPPLSRWPRRCWSACPVPPPPPKRRCATPQTREKGRAGGPKPWRRTRSGGKQDLVV
eukprot:6844178-Lingulodinium_polyedra.AAC.1